MTIATLDYFFLIRIVNFKHFWWRIIYLSRIKKCIKEEEKRTFAFDEYTEPYFNGVKKLFIETNNIDAYDESLIAARDKKLEVN